MSRDCCVALPHDVTGLSAVCDCGISLLYSLFSKTLFPSYAEGVLILQDLLHLNGTLSSNCYLGYLVQFGILS